MISLCSVKMGCPCVLGHLIHCATRGNKDAQTIQTMKAFHTFIFDDLKAIILQMIPLIHSSWKAFVQMKELPLMVRRQQRQQATPMQRLTIMQPMRMTTMCLLLYNKRLSWRYAYRLLLYHPSCSFLVAFLRRRHKGAVVVVSDLKHSN